MTERRRPPYMRRAGTFDFKVAGLRYTCTVGRFPDGSIGELFLGNHKSNSTFDTNARDAAITSSIAVQHGADPEAIRKALCRDSQGRASGPVGRRARPSRSRGRAMTPRQEGKYRNVVGHRVARDEPETAE